MTDAHPGVALGTRTTRHIATDESRRPLLIVPVGSCEQHGPHLPLDTDTRIAVALAEATASRFASPGAVMVAPPLSITASGEHAGFPGTLSIGTEVMEAVLVELVRSADWAAGVVFVNGHGGNAEPMRRAATRSGADGRRVLAWWPRIEGADAHAGHTETSLMLAIAPQLVDLDLAEAGRREPLIDLITDLREHGVMGVSPNGVLGDPTAATADHGHELMSRLVEDLVTRIDAWWTSDRTSQP
jgi:mycofactocin precursor peptide peptidase